jgi:hypothetical protein
MQIKVGKSIQRITLVSATPAGMVSATPLYEAKRKKRKQTWYLRPMERLSRRLAKAQVVGGDYYLDLHRRANGRKRDGWAKRYGKNVGKVRRRVWKVITR